MRCRLERPVWSSRNKEGPGNPDLSLFRKVYGAITFEAFLAISRLLEQSLEGGFPNGLVRSWQGLIGIGYDAFRINRVKGSDRQCFVYS